MLSLTALQVLEIRRGSDVNLHSTPPMTMSGNVWKMSKKHTIAHGIQTGLVTRVANPTITHKSSVMEPSVLYKAK